MSGSWPTGLGVGRRVHLHLGGGARLRGTVSAIETDWLVLEVEARRVAVARGQVVLVGLDDHLPAIARGLRLRTGDEGPGPRPLESAVVRRICEAFLEGTDDRAVAADSGLDRALIRRLRQAFAAARGDVDEADLEPSALALVEQVREALLG